MKSSQLTVHRSQTGRSNGHDRLPKTIRVNGTITTTQIGRELSTVNREPKKVLTKENETLERG